MATFKSFAAFGAEIEKMRKELEAGEKRKITRAQAEAGQKIADRMAARDLGSDRAFSGWKRGDPIPLDTHIKTTRSNGAVLLPEFAGGWTTAEKGRHHEGGVGRFQGPSINMRTGRTGRTKSGGIRAGRARSGVRWNGMTEGKHTASDAVKAMERELPKIADDGVRRVLRKHFDVT